MSLKVDNSFENIVASEPLRIIREQMVYASNLPRKTYQEVKENCVLEEKNREEQIRKFMVHYSVV